MKIMNSTWMLKAVLHLRRGKRWQPAIIKRHLTVVVNYATGNTCLLASWKAHPEWIREQSICNETNKDMAHSTISMLQCWPVSPQLVAAPRTAWQRLKKITLSGWGVSPAQPSDCTQYTQPVEVALTQPTHQEPNPKVASAPDLTTRVLQ